MHIHLGKPWKSYTAFKKFQGKKYLTWVCETIHVKYLYWNREGFEKVQRFFWPVWIVWNLVGFWVFAWFSYRKAFGWESILLWTWSLVEIWWEMADLFELDSLVEIWWVMTELCLFWHHARKMHGKFFALVLKLWLRKA